jgi:hypothetical protein
MANLFNFTLTPITYGLFPSAGIAAGPCGAPLFALLNDRNQSNSIVPGNSSGRGEKSNNSICIEWQVRGR